jgi:hypothetical protein
LREIIAYLDREGARGEGRQGERRREKGINQKLETRNLKPET